MNRFVYTFFVFIGIFSISINAYSIKDEVSYSNGKHTGDVVVFLMPAADAGSDTNICLGDSIEIGGLPTGPVGATYQWSNSSSLSDATVSNPKASPQTTTTYTVTVTDATNATATDQITITVDSVPFAFAGVDKLICVGTSARLGDTSGISYPNVSYKWSPDSTLDFDTVSNPMATPTVATKYKVTVTNLAGCTSTDSITITLRNLPRVNPGADRILCNGGSTNLGGMPTAPFYSTYVWDNAATLSDEFLSNPIATPTATTVYTVTATHSGVIKCSNTAQVTIYVNTLPPIDAGKDTTICAGSPVTLGGSPTVPLINASYNWSQGSSLDNKTVANPIATPLTNKLYKVTVTDGLTSCTLTDQVSVTVDTVPTAIAGPDTGLCLGSSIVLGGNSAGVSYQWDYESTLNDKSLANPTATPDSTTTYTLTVTSAGNCTATDQVIVGADTVPFVDAGSAKRICEGLSDTIGGANVPSPGFSYKWSNAASLNSSTASNPIASPITTTNYTLTVTNGLGCTATDQTTVSVDPAPLADAGANQSICLGDSLQLGGSPTSASGNIVSWTPVTGLSSSSSFNPKASPTDTTLYSLMVTNPTTLCSDSDQVMLNVNHVPIANAGIDTSMCEGDSMLIGSNSVNGVSYLWDNAISLDVSTVSNPKASPTNTTIYTVTATVSNGCTATDEMELTIHPLPNVKAGSDQTICFNDTIDLGGNPTSSGVGDTYLWANSSSLSGITVANPKAYPVDSAFYSLTVTTAFGCLDSDDVYVHVNPLPDVDFSASGFCQGAPTLFLDNSTISVGGILNWSWDFGDGTGSSLSQDPIYTYNSAGSFDVKLEVTSQLGCIDSLSKSIQITPEPMVDAGPDLEICMGDTISIGGNPSSTLGVTYYWTPNVSLSDATNSNPNAFPVSNTIYNLKVTDGNGCENNDQLELKVNNLPNIIASNDVSGCVNQTIPLNATGGDSYLWTPSQWLTDPAIQNPVANPHKSIEYVVTGTDSNGCESKDTVSIQVFNLDFSSPDLFICYGSDIQLNPIIEGDLSGITYKWSPSASLSSDNILNPIASPLNDQKYILNIENSKGCLDSDSVTVRIKPRSGLAFEYTNTVECKGAIIDVDNQTTNSNQFEWYLNNVLISTMRNPSFTIDNTVENNLTLVGFVGGCIDSLEKIIPVASFVKLMELDRPNVFSPNGDGINDFFDPAFQFRGRPLGCIEFERFQVYNRWGKLIFETSKEDETWNGQNNNGTDSEVGVYYYIVQIGGNEFKGSVYLSR